MGTGEVALTANPTITVTGGTLSDGGIISGAHSLTKAGTGALTLSGANTYSTGTTLTAGTLNINNATAIGTGTFTINGGTIDNTSGGAITLSNNNAQTWGGDFTFTGTNALNLGTGAVSLSANRQVTVSASTLTEGGIIGGAFSLTKAGAGTMTLSGANTFTGGMTLSPGTLNINNATALGTGHSPLTAERSTIPRAARSPYPTTTPRPGRQFYLHRHEQPEHGTGAVTLTANPTGDGHRRARSLKAGSSRGPQPDQSGRGGIGLVGSKHLHRRDDLVGGRTGHQQRDGAGHGDVHDQCRHDH